MKNNLIKFYLVAFYFCSTYVLVAQNPPPPGNNDGNGGLNGDGDTTPVSIDDYVWVLGLLGLVYVILKFREIYKQEISLKVQLAS